MIDEEITYREKGYRSTDLSKWSHKDIWAVCDNPNCEREGGRGRWVNKSQYRDFCNKCAIIIAHTLKNGDITEKRDYIDDDITYAEKGYRSTWLKPNSTREVWAVCANPDCEREGGRGMWVEFGRCTELCSLCAHKTEEFRRKCGDGNRGKIRSEEAIKNMKDAKKGKYSGEDNPFYGKSHTSKARTLMRENHADFSLENHPNWQGGKSFEPYCHKFNEEFKEAVREKFGWMCFMCLMDEQKNGQKLSVHHVNYDKECICNGVECEFVPLCKKCHGKTNGSRELWERLIINVLYYEGWI